MGNPLPRTPLTTTEGILPGRRLKLGADTKAAPICRDPEATRKILAENGYAGDTARISVLTGYDLVIPADSWGVVASVHHWDSTLQIIFVYLDGKFPVAVHCLALPVSQIITSRSRPPMVGENFPAPSSVTTPAPAPAPTMSATASAPVASGFDALISAVVSNLVESRIADLEAKVAASAPAGPSVVHVQINSQPARPLSSKRCHHMLTRILTLSQVVSPVTDKRLNIMLVGPAGTGKSSLCAQVAEALGLTFSSVNGSAGLTEGRLLGMLVPQISTGEMIYQPSELVRCYRDGGVFLMDEIDANDENVMLSVNNLIDAMVWQAPDGTRINRHPDFVLMSAANTFGLGANRIYSGRSQMDGSFLDRWFQVEVGYDEALERSMVINTEICARIQAARVTLAARPQIRRWLTMRAIITADALVAQAAYTADEALRAVTASWTDADRMACGL